MHALTIYSISSLNYIYRFRCAMCISALVLSTLSTIEEFQEDMTRVIIFLVSSEVLQLNDLYASFFYEAANQIVLPLIRYNASSMY